MISTLLGYFKVGSSSIIFIGFQRKWFLSVGVQIIVARIIEIVSPHYFVTTYRRYKKKSQLNSIRKHRVYTRNEMKKIFLSHTTDYGFIYARITLANMIISCFSSGIPILYVLVFLFFVVLNKVEKKFFVQHSTKPPQIEAVLVKMSTKINSFLILVHLMISLMVYGDVSLFPKKAQVNILGKLFLTK